jgi:hypothetical protein
MAEEGPAKKAARKGSAATAKAAAAAEAGPSDTEASIIVQFQSAGGDETGAPWLPTARAAAGPRLTAQVPLRLRAATGHPDDRHADPAGGPPERTPVQPGEATVLLLY